MHRISNGTQAYALPAVGPVVGQPGYATSGVPGIIPATALDSDQWNTFQEEIAAVIEHANIALDKTNNAQLLAALNALFASGAGLAALSVRVDLIPGGFRNTLVFTGSQLWTVPERLTAARVRVIGGGAGAGGSTTAQGGAGGGGGGYAEGFVFLPAGSTIPITVAGRAAGGASGAPGVAGGSSSFGTLLAAGGGTAGQFSAGTCAGGAGGYGYGPVTANGGDGGDGFAAGMILPGYGGGSVLSGGVRAGTNPVDGRGYGCGGSGCYGSALGGGSGGPGVVILEY